MQLAGPDLSGTNHAVVLSLAVGARIADVPVSIGRIVSSAPIANGAEIIQEVGASTVRARLTFPHEGVLRYEVVDWNGLNADKTSIQVASPASVNEHFYGFGEKFNAFDQSGQEVRVVTFDQPGAKGDKSYKPAPWFISPRGYGFHLDSTAESIFDMRVEETGRYAITNLFSTLAFHIVFGPKLSDVLTRYAGFTGRPPLPPPFVFGPWISSDIWRNGGEVRYAVSKYRERGIPCSVFVFDSPWETAYNDFQFNIGQGPTVNEETQFGRHGNFEDQPTLPAGQKRYEGFASLGDLMTFLQRNGLKAVCWLTPFVNTVSQSSEVPGQLEKSPTYAEGKDRGVFVRAANGGPELLVGWWKGRGSPVDFTNPTARDWFVDQLKHLVEQCKVVTQSGATESAIGGFKPDDGESLTNPDSNDTPGGEYIPVNAEYFDGRTGKQMRNGYCVEYLKTLYGVLGEKGLIFARSGFTGTQAFPACWSGDNKQDFTDANGLPSVIVAGQSSAMSGHSIWAHDIGGYLNSDLSAAEKTDVFIRWTQFGCFTPIMQMHRQPIPNSQLIRQYPWGYPLEEETISDNAALENYQFYANLHTELFPYIYSYAKESSLTGLPIIRPLVLLHQNDANTYGIKHTYYFGNEFLVAPVVDPTPKGQATKRNVYLPEGDWFEFWTNAEIAGRQVFHWLDGNRMHFPVFVRAGAIVPMLLNVPQTLCDANYVNNPAIETADAGLSFLIYPRGTSRFALYDGTEIRCETPPARVQVTLDSPPRSVLLKIHGRRPAKVLLAMTELPEHSSQAALDAAATGWRHDASVGFVFAKFDHPGGSTEVTLVLT